MQLAAEIVAAYVSNHSVPKTELLGLISAMHGALTGITNPAANAPAMTNEAATSTQIRRSVTPDHLVSFLDGRSYKTLKRHLTGHGLDPHSYRQRFGLPSDYPMVASNYAAQRSALAKQIGLGRPGGRSDQTAETTEPKARGHRKAA